MTSAFLMTLCRYFQLSSVSRQSTEFFGGGGGGFVPLGRSWQSWGLKNEIGLQEF